MEIDALLSPPFISFTVGGKGRGREFILLHMPEEGKMGYWVWCRYRGVSWGLPDVPWFIFQSSPLFLCGIKRLVENIGLVVSPPFLTFAASKKEVCLFLFIFNRAVANGCDTPSVEKYC